MSLGSLAKTAAGRLSWRNVRELGWVLAGQGVATIASVALTKIVASSLGANQYGRYALGLTAAVLLNQFLLGPITTSAIRFFSVFRDQGRLPAFIAALRKSVERILAGVAAVALPAAFIVGRLYGAGWALLFIAATAFGVVQNVFSLMNALDIAARNRVRAAMYQAADPICRLVAAAVVLALFARTATVAMIAVAAGLGLAAISQWVMLRRGFAASVTDWARADDRSVAAAFKTLFDYAKYFIVAGVFAWLQLSSDRWAVKLYLNDASVGVFVAAYQIASVPAVILAGCLSQFISPIVFQRAQVGTSRTAITAARRAIFVGVAALVVLTGASSAFAFFFGERLMVFFTSPAYRAGGPYVAPLIVGLGLFQIGTMLSLLPMSSNRLGGHVAIKIAHGTIAVTLNVLAVRAYGLSGLCGASIAAGSAFVVLVLMNNRRIMRTLTPETLGPMQSPVLQA